MSEKWIKEAEKLLEPLGFKLGFKRRGKLSWVYVEIPPDNYKIWFGSITQVVFFMKAIHEYIERRCKDEGQA